MQCIMQYACPVQTFIQAVMFSVYLYVRRLRQYSVNSDRPVVKTTGIAHHKFIVLPLQTFEALHSLLITGFIFQDIQGSTTGTEL